MQVKHHDSKLKADNYWTCQLYFAGVMAAEEGLFAQFHQPLPWNKTNKVLFSLFPVWPLQWPFAWNSVPTALPSVLCTLLEWSSQTQAEPRPTVLKILHWPLITGLIPFLKEVSSEDWSLFCLNMEHVIGRLASSFWWWCFLFVCLLFLSRARDGSLSVGNPFVLSDHYGSDLWLCRGNKRSNNDSNVIPVDGTDETPQEKMLPSETLNGLFNKVIRTTEIYWAKSWAPGTLLSF